MTVGRRSRTWCRAFSFPQINMPCYERYNALAKALKEPTISNGLPIGPVKYDRVHTVRVPMPNPVLLDPHALSQLPCVFDFLDHEMVEAVRVMPLVSNGTKCAQ